MGNPSRDRTRLRFGPFEVDSAAGEPRKHGLRIKLQKQPLQILTALLERPNEVVTRDELRLRVWRGDTFVDFEHGLNAALNKLRQALADSSDKPSLRMASSGNDEIRLLIDRGFPNAIGRIRVNHGVRDIQAEGPLHLPQPIIGRVHQIFLVRPEIEIRSPDGRFDYMHLNLGKF